MKENGEYECANQPGLWHPNTQELCKSCRVLPNHLNRGGGRHRCNNSTYTQLSSYQSARQLDVSVVNPMPRGTAMSHNDEHQPYPSHNLPEALNLNSPRAPNAFFHASAALSNPIRSVQRIHASLARDAGTKLLEHHNLHQGPTQVDINDGSAQLQIVQVDGRTWYLDVAHSPMSASISATWFCRIPKPEPYDPSLTLHLEAVDQSPNELRASIWNRFRPPRCHHHSDFPSNFDGQVRIVCHPGFPYLDPTNGTFGGVCEYLEGYISRNPGDACRSGYCSKFGTRNGIACLGDWELTPCCFCLERATTPVMDRT